MPRWARCLGRQRNIRPRDRERPSGLIREGPTNPGGIAGGERELDLDVVGMVLVTTADGEQEAASRFSQDDQRSTCERGFTSECADRPRLTQYQQFGACHHEPLSDLDGSLTGDRRDARNSHHPAGRVGSMLADPGRQPTADLVSHLMHESFIGCDMTDNLL